MKRSWPLLAVFSLIYTALCLQKSTLELLPSPVRFAIVAAFVAALCGLAYYYRSKPAPDFTDTSTLRPGRFLIVAILAAAAFLRLWKLGSQYEGMPWDEAYKGLDAYAIRVFHDRPIHLDWNAGREAMIAYLVAFSQLFFDQSMISVRIVIAVAGLLTVVFFYLFAKTVFGPRFAVLSTFLFAVSKWNVIHSRYAVRVTLYPLFEIVVLYFLARAFSNGSRKPALLIVLAGIAGGLGLYTYIAFRIAPLIVLAFLFEKPIRVQLRQHWKALSAAVGAALLVAAPLVHFFLSQPGSFHERMSRTASWAEKGRDEAPETLILESTMRTLGMFTYSGDTIAKHNVIGEPMLSPFLIPFFFLGILVLLLRIRKDYALFLIAFLLISLLPGFLSQQAPQSSRTLAASLPAILISTAGLLAALEIVRTYPAPICTLFLGVALGGAFQTGMTDSMFRWPEQLDSMTVSKSPVYGMDREQTHIALLIQQLGEKCQIYVTPQFYYHATVEYLNYPQSQHKLFSQYSVLDKDTPAGKVAVIFYQPRPVNLWWLRDDEGKRFFKWWAEARETPEENIRAVIHRSYISGPRMTKGTDLRLYALMKRQHPEGREINLGRFNAYIVKP